jgi:uncharacterized Zn finger protein
MSRTKTSAEPPSRFDIAAVRAKAGDAAFARGSAYAREGLVRLISVTATDVRAEVSGTEVYPARLSGAGRVFSGACVCPAFADWGFCKHLVAVALVVNATSPADLAEAAGRRERLEAHLRGLGGEALAAKLLAWAERDLALLQELEFEAALAGEGDQVVFDRIASALDQATEIDDYVDWRSAGALADELRAVVEQIGRVLEAGRSSIALRLLDRLFDEAEDLFESIDDSEGEVGGVFAEALELHLAVAVAAKPDPIDLAETLLERELASNYELWDGACGLYADVLGPAGVAEYRRLAEAAWASGDREGRLRGILDAFAEAAGDVDARIKLRSADATTGRQHLEIAALYLEAGRKQEARKWLEDGLWKAEDRPEHGLERIAAGLYQRLGEPAEAQAILWAAFERTPGLQLHLVLLEHAVDAREVVDRSVALLSKKISAGERAHWSSSSTLTVEILCHAGRHDEAWAVVEQHGCAEPALEQLLRASEESHPDQAIQTHARLIDAALAYANQSAYAGVVGRIARMERISARIGRLERHGAYVEALALKHKAKRTFIRLLNDRASWPRVKA